MASYHDMRQTGPKRLKEFPRVPTETLRGEYQQSSGFTRDEIPVARHLLAKAWDFILDTEAK
jgi:hypothetical protein